MAHRRREGHISREVKSKLPYPCSLTPSSRILGKKRFQFPSLRGRIINPVSLQEREPPPPPSVRLPSLCSVSPNRTKKENPASRGYPKGRSKKRREEARCATLTLPDLKNDCGGRVMCNHRQSNPNCFTQTRPMFTEAKR